MKAQKVYISGPMTGRADFNYPAFNAVEEAIRSMGFEVENPARNPDPEPLTWEGFMRMAIKQVCDCDMVVLLPEWWESKGAMVEVNLAKTLGMKCIPVETFLPDYTTEQGK